MSEQSTSKRGLLAWCGYDWANSALATVIETFVFGPYFIRAVVRDEGVGSAKWGYTVGLAGLTVAVLGPVLGAIADQGGRRKPWIAAFTALAVVASGLLWFVKPDSAYVPMAMTLVAMGVIGVEFSGVFYNAMLPALAKPGEIGRWSGWAWAIGYAGGLACLIVALVVFVMNDKPPFGLDADRSEHIRATFVLASVWFAVFSLPLFFFTPDQPRVDKTFRRMVRDGLGQLADSVRQVRRYASILRFLVARMIYIDGLTTIFTFGGVYAAAAFGMSEAKILIFGIVLNVTAGLGAAAFAWIDDWIGSKRTIIVSLVGLIACVGLLLLTTSHAWFWVLGSTLGIFVGPVQAASRSYLARAAPPELRTQMFGLYALSGKATAFLGPILVGSIAYWTGSTRVGMSVILVFLAAGFVLLLTVKEADATRA